MKLINLPENTKTRFKHKTKQLIDNLLLEIEENEFTGDSDARECLNTIRAISDVGERHKAVLWAFSQALVE